MKTQHVHYAQSIFRIAVIHLISDLHLNPDQPALLEHFDQYSNTLDPGDDLYILGDLFEYWLGDDAADFLDHFPDEAYRSSFFQETVTSSSARNLRTGAVCESSLTNTSSNLAPSECF